jgi:hypothetical protein
VERKLNYVVTCFMGQRRLKTVSDPEYFIHRHLSFLQKHNCDVARVTLVLNADNQEQIDKLYHALEDYSDYYTEIKVVVRENKGFSYAAWADVVNQCIENDEGFTEYMLLEDDYAPGTPDFIEKYESVVTPNTGYVCQKTSDLTLTKIFKNPIHPGISCGLLMGKPAEQAYRKHGTVFPVFGTARYDMESLQAQVYFLYYIVQDLGYNLEDSTSFSSVIFVHVFPGSARGWSLMEYSDPSLPRVIEPVIEWSIFTKGENEADERDRYGITI